MSINAEYDKILIEYIKKGDLLGVKEILADGANANYTSGSLQRTPLIYAVGLQDIEPRVREEIIEWLLCYDARPEISDIDGWTPLHAAVAHHDIESAKSLLKKNPKIINQAMENGTTPLHSAVFLAMATGNTEFISFLLQQGADPEIKNQGNKTPLEVVQAYETTLTNGKKLLDCFVKPELIKAALDEAAYRAAVDAQLVRIKSKRPNVKFMK